MQAFTFSVPQNILVEREGRKKLPEIIKKLGKKKAFIISGPHLAKMGLVQEIREILEAAGIASGAYTKTEGNPSVETVDAAAEAFLDSGADLLVAFGGGSPMDVAKAVGVVAKYGGSITDYEGADKVPGEIIPVVAIPTTAGTGSEVTAFSVITDHSRNYKLTVFSYKLLPVYAILDASLLTTAPASVAAACGIDAMIHAAEAYLSTAASPFSDAMAEKALEMIGASIRRYVANRGNVEAAEQMLVGSLFAGIAFSWARLGDVHAMSHPVSANFNVPHGVANAVLLPVVLDFNSLADRGRYYQLYTWLSGKRMPEEDFDVQMLVEAVRKLNGDLGIPKTFAGCRATADQMERMAEDAMKSGNIQVNPRTTTKADVLRMYREVFAECPEVAAL